MYKPFLLTAFDSAENTLLGRSIGVVLIALMFTACSHAPPRSPSTTPTQQVAPQRDLLQESKARFERARNSSNLPDMASALAEYPPPPPSFLVAPNSASLGSPLRLPEQYLVKLVRAGKPIQNPSATPLLPDDLVELSGDIRHLLALPAAAGLIPTDRYRENQETLDKMRLETGRRFRQPLKIAVTDGGSRCDPLPTVNGMSHIVSAFFSDTRIEYPSTLYGVAPDDTLLSIELCFKADQHRFTDGSLRWASASVVGRVTLTVGYSQLFSQCFSGDRFGETTLYYSPGTAPPRRYLNRYEAPYIDALIFSDIPVVLTKLIEQYWGKDASLKAATHAIQEIGKYSPTAGSGGETGERMRLYVESLLELDPERFGSFVKASRNTRPFNQYLNSFWQDLLQNGPRPRIMSMCEK